MAIYNDIIEWSENKAPWIKDALRRLITQTAISEKDLDEIFLLLRKETGREYIKLEPLPITNENIPDDKAFISDSIILNNIKNPSNINALHDESALIFNKIGLNVIYGDNGSGKSGYARILKKVCWSRDKNFQLKKNVFKDINEEQSFIIDYAKGDKSYTFEWAEDAQTPVELNSINVFDIACSNLYINNENPTEYKPIGLDLLERLIIIFNKLTNKIDTELAKLNTDKPILDASYNETEIYKWYLNIEDLNLDKVKKRIVFSDENKGRLIELTTLLSKSNPEKENEGLAQKINRYEIVNEKLKSIENYFEKDNINLINQALKDFKSKKEAYDVATKKIEGDDPLSGIGSETWRLLWEAAKNFAVTEVHPSKEDFPSDLSEEYCVFCQQILADDAKERLRRFNLFITDTTSSQFQKAKEKIDELIDDISKINIPLDTTIDELEAEIEGFRDKFIKFKKDSEAAFELIISSLKSSTEIGEIKEFQYISNLTNSRIEKIISEIKSNLGLLAERKKLLMEFNELSALKSLFKEKERIIKYHKEDLTKYWLNKARLKTNTRIISQKIGEIQEDNAIQEQLNELKKHLSYFNTELADKIILRKTRTAQGETYQQCTFQDIDEKLREILSEGEQKLITLSNFIAECTIGNSKNTIVFDDPVTSLDQNYKEKIAKLIVKLSADRQVIILTHDLNFVRLLIDESNKLAVNDYNLIGLNSNAGISGIVNDEIPYLAKNIQERIDSIRIIIKEIKGISPTQIDKIQEKLEIASKRIRFLLEKTVEDILANKSIQRFSKNINLKARPLSGYVVTEKSDIDFILSLFGKYSVPEHDGDVPAEFQKPKLDDIVKDLDSYEKWKIKFTEKQNKFIKDSGYK